MSCGFGDDFPFFWIGARDEGPDSGTHVAFTAPDRATVAPSTPPRWRPAGRTTARPGCARSTTRTTTAPSCSTPTATTSRRSATPRPDRTVGPGGAVDLDHCPGAGCCRCACPPLSRCRSRPGLPRHPRGPAPGDPYAISQPEFASHMAALADAGFHAISIDQYARFAAGYTAALPDRPILITFDDGRLDSYRGADAALGRYGMRATMFVITPSRRGRAWIPELGPAAGDGRGPALGRAGACARGPRADSHRPRRPHRSVLREPDLPQRHPRMVQRVQTPGDL